MVRCSAVWQSLLTTVVTPVISLGNDVFSKPKRGHPTNHRGHRIYHTPTWRIPHQVISILARHIISPGRVWYTPPSHAAIEGWVQPASTNTGNLHSIMSRGTARVFLFSAYNNVSRYSLFESLPLHLTHKRCPSHLPTDVDLFTCY